jgi:uncharacterized protein (DUF305 family)
MKPTLRHRATVAALLVCAALSGSGCTSRRPDAAETAARPGTARADSLADLEALFRARLAEDRARFTVADVRFMTDMIAHHGQALHMARLVPARGADRGVQGLAARILVGQQDEIVVMQQWLRERGQPVPSEEARPGEHAHHHAPMAGMLTQAQIEELERARGREFDRLFLTYMIEHHRGAITMVDALLASDGAAQDPVVFRLAADIHAEQTAEIGRMQRMLLALLGTPGTR